ncbi:MAG: hypothetical protein HXX13_18385, partial [Bacteroidetes bacterium]|nr:hypothetical protein [Bacteroidota bacterium]
MSQDPIDFLISQQLDLLVKIIDELPCPRKQRMIMKYLVVTDFTESLIYNPNYYPAYDDFWKVNGSQDKAFTNLTSGIHNYPQLKRYLTEFAEKLKFINNRVGSQVKLCETNLKYHSNAYPDYNIRNLKTQDLLKRYGINQITKRELDHYLEAELGNKYPKILVITAPDLNDDLRRLFFKTEKELNPILGLEHNVCLYFLDILYNLLKNSLTDNYQFDNEYFDTNIYNLIRGLYFDSLKSKIERMTARDSLQYLEQSVYNYQNYNPETRLNILNHKLFCYFSTAYSIDKNRNSYVKRFAQDTTKAFIRNFPLFRTEIERMFNNCKEKANLDRNIIPNLESVL